MQLDLLDISLNCAAAILPKTIKAPRHRVNRCYFASGRVGAAVQPDVFLERLDDMVKKPNLSESDMVQIFGVAESFFDSLGDWEIADAEAAETAAQQISYVTALLATASYNIAQRYKSDLQSLQEDKIRLIREKESIFARQETDKRLQKEYLAKCDALEQRLRQLERDVDADMQEIIQARRDLDDIRAKEEELRKWCWVPFYNIYLYVDSEKAASRYQVCQERLNAAKKQQDSLMREKEALHNEMILNQHMEAEIRARLNSNEQAMQRCIEAVNQAKSKALQYSDFTVFFGKINARLQYQDAEEEMIINILKDLKALLVAF